VSVAPLTSVVMGAVDRRYAGTASGINNAVSRVAALVAVAALSAVFLSIYGREIGRQLSALDMPPEARRALDAQRDRLAEIEIPEALPEETKLAVRRTVSESFVAGFRAVMLTAAALGAAGAVCALVLVEGAARRPR
jgi:hypothetical protein